MDWPNRTGRFDIMASIRQSRGLAISRRKATVYLDEDGRRASRVLAARTGQHEYEMVNAAVRGFLGLAAVERVWARGELSEADKLASSDLRSIRDEKRSSDGSR